MICLRNLLGYGLTVAIVGGLGASGLWMQPSTLNSSAVNDDTSHRGSGRLVTQGDMNGHAIAYRGTGRAPDGEIGWDIAHRGSGRTPASSSTGEALSYRGTGRISSESPQPFSV